MGMNTFGVVLIFFFGTSNILQFCVHLCIEVPGLISDIHIFELRDSLGRPCKKFFQG